MAGGRAQTVAVGDFWQGPVGERRKRGSAGAEASHPDRLDHPGTIDRVKN